MSEELPIDTATSFMKGGALDEEATTFASGREQLRGFLARPAGAQSRLPALVVVHEVFGLTESMRDIARRFAREGYVALAVDLFTGRNRPLCIARVIATVMTGSTEHRGTRDLRAALDALVARPEVDPARLGAVGFCMGGSFAIALACTDPRLRVVAPFYGFNPRPIDAVARSCPVVGSYPERDFTAAAGRGLDVALDRFGVAHDIKIYPGARHSFMSEDSRFFDPAASEDAWRRTLSFFAEQLCEPSAR